MPNEFKLEIYSETQLPTKHGIFRCVVVRDQHDVEHLAMIKGEVESETNVSCRIHSECLTGEVFDSLKCDCKPQLDSALDRINREGVGILLYLRQEGRGIGLGNKIKAYSIQEQGADTVDANILLGFPEDAREYGLAVSMLKMLEVNSIELMTNNPKKIRAIQLAGIDVKHAPHQIASLHDAALAYIKVKKDRMGHL